MVFRFSSYFLFVCTGCAVALPTNFEIQTNESNDTVVLSKIISNYIVRYLSDETVFISLVYASYNENVIRFHEELTTNLCQNANRTDFSYNIGNALIGQRRLRRRAFNIILVDDITSLRQVYLTLNSYLL